MGHIKCMYMLCTSYFLFRFSVNANTPSKKRGNSPNKTAHGRAALLAESFDVSLKRPTSRFSPYGVCSGRRLTDNARPG